MNQKVYDSNRTYELQKLGITVIRFTNKQIENNLDAVLKELISECIKLSINK